MNCQYQGRDVVHSVHIHPRYKLQRSTILDLVFTTSMVYLDRLRSPLPSTNYRRQGFGVWVLCLGWLSSNHTPLRNKMAAATKPISSNWRWKRYVKGVDNLENIKPVPGNSSTSIDQWTDCQLFPSEIYVELLRCGHISDPLIGFNEHKVQCLSSGAAGVRFDLIYCLHVPCRGG
jgi:hypothetical protein